MVAVPIYFKRFCPVVYLNMMNESEFERVLVENQDRIYRLALRITGNREEALDVTQETMFSAFSSRHRFRGDAKVATYLYRIGLNHAFAVLKKRRYVSLPLERVERIKSKDDNPAQVLHHQEKAEEMAKLLEVLPPQQKAAVHLRIYENLSFAEVGQALGCRTATARAHYFFGLQNLRKQVKIMQT